MGVLPPAGGTGLETVRGANRQRTEQGPAGVREGELAALLKDLDLHSAWENQESKEDSQGEGVTSTNDPVDVPRKTVSTVMQPERWPPPGACV